jgi:hypothetical protein
VQKLALQVITYRRASVTCRLILAVKQINYQQVPAANLFSTLNKVEIGYLFVACTQHEASSSSSSSRLSCSLCIMTGAVLYITQNIHRRSL